MVLCQSGCGKTTYQLYTHSHQKHVTPCMCINLASINECLPPFSYILRTVIIYWDHIFPSLITSIRTALWKYQTNIAMLFPHGCFTTFSLLMMVKKYKYGKYKKLFELIWIGKSALTGLQFEMTILCTWDKYIKVLHTFIMTDLITKKRTIFPKTVK